MDLKAGSYNAPKGGNLKFYREEELETNEFSIERVYSGGKLTIRLFVKDANYQGTIVLIPQGSIEKFYFLRMGMDLKDNLFGSGSTSAIGNVTVGFNNLTVDNIAEVSSFTPYRSGDSDELKRFEDANHTYHRYTGSTSFGQHPSVDDKPLLITLNQPGVVYPETVRYELLMEFNYYDK